MTNSKTCLNVLITPEAIHQRVTELARAIQDDLGEDKPVLMGILKGCFMFFTDLARELRMDVDVDFIRVASYGAGTESSGEIVMLKAPEIDLKGRSVIVVEDIIDTGLTLSWLKDHLYAMGPKQVKICVFIDKAERRAQHVDVDYVGFKVPKGFLVGYGLDYNEQYRNLPGVFELSFEPDN